MRDHMPCYGKLFPSIQSREPGKHRVDAVFGYRFPQCGAVPQPPDITVDLEAWDRCLECAEFGTCRELSAARVMLEMAVRN